MIIRKLDYFLQHKTQTLANDKEVVCFVRCHEFEKFKELLIKLKIKIIDEYLFIKTFFIKARMLEILNLSDVANVEFISSSVTASALTYLSKQILNTNKTSLSGRGVRFALIDTGIMPHLDFCIGKNRIKTFVDFVSNKKETYDDNGHGTFVCGVVAGNGAESLGKFSGISPQSEIVSLKALDKNGEANSNTILSAMEWLFDNHKKQNIKVVCMSFGSEPLGFRDPIMVGAEALWNDGVIVVSAAGNSGPEFQTIKSPGVCPKIITVGGLNDNRVDEISYNEGFFEVAEFSSRGPAFQRFKPDVIAPAVDIKSCDKNGGYTILSGTSVATPMIVGMMNLLCEKYPDITPNEAKKKLISICKPISYNKNNEGFGIPDFGRLNI